MYITSRINAAGGAIKFAENAIRNATCGPLSVIAASEAEGLETVFIDATLPEEQRIEAVASLLPNHFNRNVIDAAVDLATQSGSADTRARMLELLRDNRYDTTLAQPVATMLVSDPDANLRLEAARTLATYANDASRTFRAKTRYRQFDDATAQDKPYNHSRTTGSRRADADRGGSGRNGIGAHPEVSSSRLRRCCLTANLRMFRARSRQEKLNAEIPTIAA